MMYTKTHKLVIGRIALARLRIVCGIVTRMRRSRIAAHTQAQQIPERISEPQKKYRRDTRSLSERWLNPKRVLLERVAWTDEIGWQLIICVLECSRMLCVANPVS